VEAVLAVSTPKNRRRKTGLGVRAEPVVYYNVDLHFNGGKVRVSLREDGDGLKILSMRSYPRRKGFGRKALQFLREKNLVGEPVNVRDKAVEFWAKMRLEGLVK
jgi:hypothetical protein